MAYETLQEAGQSSTQCAIQLFCAVRSMFELFCSVFPTYHKQQLESLPQFSGEIKLSLIVIILNLAFM